MDPWTPADRNAFIDSARTSDALRGQKGPYHFKVLPKLNGNDFEDPKRTAVNEALAKCIFENPKYRIFSLKFYQLLVDKIRGSVFVNQHFMTNFFIILKGGTAYKFILGDFHKDDFSFSDLDIIICINPFLSDDLFNALRYSLHTILMQVISQYKRALDHMLFLNRPSPDWVVDQEIINSFKEDIKTAFESITGFEGNFITPFENDELRNSCSKNSFMIMDHLTKPENVVRVEVPHFEKCERIPLRKTPLVASFNSSIKFNRDKNNTMVGEFDLFRLKFTTAYIGFNEDVEDMYEEKIASDFIDVSIPSKHDSELIDFWQYGKCMNIYVPEINIWVVVPDIPTCIMDLHKMLYIYECPEHKKEKRERRYQIFKSIYTLPITI